MGRITSMPSSGETMRERSRQRVGRAMAVEGLARLKSARSSSKRAAAHETILEVEILLQRLLHLIAPPSADDEAKALLAMAREVYETRRNRERVFGQGLFSDPSWDILLDLYISRREARKVTISSACIAASAPSTTATRHIAHLVQRGLVLRIPHPADARSSYLELSPKADVKLSQLFREMLQAADDRAA
ncbi:MAG: MarR family transcriptional regulator [Alphaproteobacteria bacterium]|nr:MarR family transcriptional regulator [Alphaproteobacteria bacterium]